ncbi:MAG: urease accessory protein UreD [Planctomycetota bacterium]|nr:urease accessory protein UreD [Planctomycetota bacterium]
MTETSAVRGKLELASVGGRTVVTRACAGNPLKLLLPRPREHAAWVYTSSCGGGLGAGDQVALDVKVGPGAACVLGTQSATKVYKCPGDKFCRQELRAKVEGDGFLVLAPDPVICFADSAYEQYQRVDLEPGSSLVVLDWISSGRRLRGERWAFRSYSSRLDVHVGDEQVLCESLRLDSTRSPVGSEFKTGGFDCLAVVGLFGEKVVDAVSALLDMISGQPFEPGQEIVEAVSPVSHGAALRVMGSTPELVGRYLDEKLGFLAELIGESPWSRKW